MRITPGAFFVSVLLLVNYIRTKTGISKGHIEWGVSDDDIEKIIQEGIAIIKGNIGGEGQGGGASPIMWLVVLIVMIKTYQQFTTGAEVRDPIELEKLVIYILSYVDDNSIVKSFESDKTVEEIFEEVAQDMNRWRRILQSTGGDLAVPKCTVSLMKWKWSKQTNTPQLVKTIEAPGTVKIEMEKKVVELRRLEVDESEKQLRIIMPINGSFEQEFHRRKNMSEDLAKQMYTAPLTSYESVLVYRLYYCSKISFPLSITKFTRKQCEDIQSQFYRKALPKMGINRHMPHAIVFGPIEYAGMDFHHIYSNQIIKHITTILNHIRRNDFTGNTFIKNIHAYSITIGSAKPLFDISPTQYPYGEKTSTVYWLWKINYWWKLNIKLPADRGIRQVHKEERYTIMDDAARDKQINGSEETLAAINACRLYHGISYPSEMLHYDGQSFNKKFMYSTHCQRKKSHRDWPTQPSPPDKQWIIWRTFI